MTQVTDTHSMPWDDPGEPKPSEVQTFYDRVDAMENGVVVAQFPQWGKTGIFSTLEKAQRWADRERFDDSDQCVFSPYVIDEPDWGEGLNA